MPDDLDHLPPALRAALQRADAPPPLPPEVDAAILARAGYGLRHRRRVRRLEWGLAIGAAAALVVAVALPYVPHHLTPAASVAAAPKRHVDILDAFALARQLDAHASPGRAWDANHDGRVDRQDVSALAAAAVSLHREAL